MLKNYQNNLNSISSVVGNEPLRVARVVKVKYPDKNQEVANYVLYDLIGWDENGSTFHIENARKLSDLASFNDFEETILEADEVALEGEFDISNPTKDMNGSLVIVAFINNNKRSPIIIGGLSHPRFISEAIEENGRVSSRKFRGLSQKINKDGELEITFTGASTPDGKPIDEEQPPIVFKMGNKDEVGTENAFVFKLVANKEQKLLGFETPKGQKIQINDQDEQEEISLSHFTGSKIEINPKGSITAETPAGQKLLLDEENSEASVVESGGAKIVLKEGKAALGSTAEIFDEVIKALTEIAGVWDQFVQSAPNFTATAVGPGALDPGIATKLTSAKAAIDGVKSALDGVKGTL